MKEVTKSSCGTNFVAADFGKMSEWNQYELVLNPEVRIAGKVFGSSVLHTTGSEFSFQSFAPGAETGFLHTHKTHEELYFFLSGEGQMVVDGTLVPVAEGSVVRVSPAGKRSVRNTGSVPLVMLCVQYKAVPFDESDASDGNILSEPVVWNE